jgi:multiple sugar transport system ATP-binding protein
MRDGVVQQFGAPQEIYDTPANLFVAAFMGSPGMNFIPVELGAAADDVTCRVQPKGQPAIVWTLPHRASELAAWLGRTVLLGVRPEQITDRRTAHRADLPELMADVDLTEPTGADTLVSIRLNDTKICCRVHPGEAAVPGRPMPFIVDLSKSLLFDRDSGRRIA